MADGGVDVLDVAPAIFWRFFSQNMHAVTFGGCPFQPIASW